MKRAAVFFLGWIICCTISRAQDSSYRKPEMISAYRVYRNTLQFDSAKRMIELKTCMPNLRYDLRYASLNNFMHRLMYPAGTRNTWLRLPAARALQQVQATLNGMGLGLKIFDAYRPWSVTAKFWELVKDDRYVANPAHGSGHNRGAAVDLTIIRMDTGEELDMGTGFDNFTDSAHQNFYFLPEKVLQNRKLLKSLMEKNGFKALDSEWWHYSLPDASIRYEILNIPFKKMDR